MSAFHWALLLALCTPPVLAQNAAPGGVTNTPASGPGRMYTPGDFDSIEISGSALVRFVQGSTDQVLVEGDEDMQKSVTLEVRDGLLLIRPAGSWKFWNNQRLQVQVTARDLRRVTISGAADLLAAAPVRVGALSVGISGAGLARFDHLKADKLDFSVSGSGDGQLAGSVGDLRLQISGRSTFNGQELLAQQARVAISGLGHVKVWVAQDLRVAVSGVGTVDHWGSARVQRSSAGIARINDHGPKPAPP